MDSLPRDQILEIFSWLPAKSINRFKSSCKLFSEISTKSFFVHKQSQNSLLKVDSGFLLQPDSWQRFSDMVELYPLLPSDRNSSGVPQNSLQFLANTSRILASSNGLLLCRSTIMKQINLVVPELFLCNPVTQSWLAIPTPESIRKKPYVDVHVVFDCNHDCLALFSLITDEWSDSGKYECRIYSQKEGIWKRTTGILNAGARSIKFEMHVFHNGNLHFVSDCYPYLAKGTTYYKPYIVSFNIKNGESRILRMPKEAVRGSQDSSCKFGIFKWGRTTIEQYHQTSICLVRLRKSMFTIWVLTNYNSVLWTRVLKIRVRAMGVKEKNSIIAGFIVMNGDSLVFATEKKIYRYGLMGESRWKIEQVCDHGCGSSVYFKSYASTLRPCGNGATALPYAGV
ncbi:F-box protein [Quillaja saponaria]|uniref:F-box protein n=1 Tax=Quillaja saponaria TaxID=32244 RepID=A0AAD7L0Y9_QUISA|nr:F-box protein [Quillaja saponaria]